MELRRLEMRDAPLMLDWMHDKEVTRDLAVDFATKTLKDCETFIHKSWNDENNVHFAIVSDEDEYMGTVSLMHIEGGSAEFAIIVRAQAMGRGYSWFGMGAILERAFNEYGLESVYWCVSRENARAVRFFDKHGFKEMLDVPAKVLSFRVGKDSKKWYSTLAGDSLNARATVAGCKVIRIRTVPTVGAGELSFFEANNDVAFEIRRVYYISKVPEGVRRGFHAHKRLRQLLFCPYGRIQLVLENRHGREEVELADPSVGVLIEDPTWREMLWLQRDSVLCIAASDYYDPDDYIRDHDVFTQFITESILH